MLNGIGKSIGDVIKRFAKRNGWEKSRRLSDRRVLRNTLKTIRSAEFSRSSLTGSPLSRVVE